MSNMKKLALAMIIKGNEVDEVKRCLKSILAYVDHAFITTTQTKDNWKDLEDKKITLSHFDWIDDFSAARNFNFEQTKGYKYVLWLDSDDVVQNARIIPEVVKEMDNQNLDGVFVDYNYEIDPRTKEVVIVHPRERIVRNGKYKWKAALHETLVPKVEVNTQYIKDFAVNHWPTNENKISGIERNIRILSKQYAGELKEVAKGLRKEPDPRTEYYLARCLFDTHTQKGYERAATLFQDYLSHSGWDEERAQAWHYLGGIFYLQGNYDDAISCYESAIHERPEWPSWYIALARTYAMKKDFRKAEFYVNLGLSIKQPQTAAVLTPRDDKINALNTLFLVYFHKRDMKRALKVASELFEIMPTKEHKDKMESAAKLVRWGEWMRNISDMVSVLGEQKREDKILNLLASLPEEVQNTVIVDKLRNTYLPPKKWPKGSVVYFCGAGFESWTPKNLSQGIGGSETAVIQLSKLWTKAGYKVTVYGNPGADEGEYDGVEYLNYYRFNQKDQFDNLIIWRNPSMLDMDWKANKVFLDLHDVPNPMEFTADRLKKVDKIFIKTKYHQTFLPHVKQDKFVIVPNGVDRGSFKWSKSKRDPFKLIYASSYDRGLEYMLKYGWPIIREKFPQATLDIYYGWKLFDSFYSDNPERMAWKKRMIELMSQPGVTEKGRVGQSDLIKAKSKAKILYYATTFEEIDCITVRQAAMAGCIPVTTDYAALKEKPYCQKVKGDPYDRETQEAVARKVVELLGKDTTKLSDEIKQLAKKETWDEISKVWVKNFNAGI